MEAQRGGKRRYMADLSKEKPIQKEAFEIYYHLGDKRSLKKVAEKVDRTERTVAGWSRAFNWVDRCKQREIEDVRNQTLDKATLNAETTEIKTRYRIMINNLMAKASKKIADGSLGIKNVSDYERMVKLDLLLMGESTERAETVGSVSGTTELSQADKERLDAIARLLDHK